MRSNAWQQANKKGGRLAPFFLHRSALSQLLIFCGTFQPVPVNRLRYLAVFMTHQRSHLDQIQVWIVQLQAGVMVTQIVPPDYVHTGTGTGRLERAARASL